jgi:DNA invertase Pin-like site-specific DNA recombinase
VTPGPGVSRSDRARGRLILKVQQEIAVEILLRSIREDEADAAAELLAALREETRKIGRPTAVLALDDQQEISEEELELVRNIWRLHMSGHKPPEIARLLGVSSRRVRNVLGKSVA